MKKEDLTKDILKDFEEITGEKMEPESKAVPEAKTEHEAKTEPEAETEQKNEIKANTEQKRGRGRPKGSFKKKPPVIEEKGQNNEGEKINETKEKTGEEKLNEFLSSFEEVKSEAKESAPTTPAQSEQGKFKVQVSGYMLLIVTDIFIPSLITYFVHRYKPETKKTFKTSDIKMTDDEKKELEELADEVARELFGKIEPLPAFLLSISILYGAKTIDKLSQ